MISLKVDDIELNIIAGTNTSLPLVSGIQPAQTNLYFSGNGAYTPNLIWFSPFGSPVYDGFTLDLQSYIFTNEGYSIFEGNVQHANLGDTSISALLFSSHFNNDIMSFVTRNQDAATGITVSFSEFPMLENGGNYSGTTTFLNYYNFPYITTFQASTLGLESGGPLGLIALIWRGNALNDALLTLVNQTGHYQIAQVTDDILGWNINSYNGLRYFSIVRNNNLDSSYKIVDYLPTNIGDPQDFNIDDFSLSVLSDDVIFQSAFSNSNYFMKGTKPCVLISYDTDPIVPFILEFSEDFSTYKKYTINPNDALTTAFIAELLLNNIFITASYSEFDSLFYFTGGDATLNTFYAMEQSIVPPTPTISTYRSRMPIKLECGNYCIPLMKR